MNRHLTADELSALALGLDGESEDAGQRVHLDSCSLCREALAADAALLRSLGECQAPEPSLARWDRTMREALEEISPLPASLRVDPSPRPLAARLREWGMRAAVLCVVFLLGFHAGSQRQGVSESQPSPGVRLMHEPPLAPALHRLPSRDAAPTTASIPSQYLLVRSEDQPC